MRNKFTIAMGNFILSIFYSCQILIKRFFEDQFPFFFCREGDILFNDKWSNVTNVQLFCRMGVKTKPEESYFVYELDKTYLWVTPLPLLYSVISIVRKMRGKCAILIGNGILNIFYSYKNFDKTSKVLGSPHQFSYKAASRCSIFLFVWVMCCCAHVQSVPIFFYFFSCFILHEEMKWLFRRSWLEQHH